jgi:asparagine synthase (glutamine-hydrolysing)
VLKEAMRGKLPEAVLRRRKSGFNAPVSGWLRGSLRPMVEELFAQPSGLVDVRHPLLQSTWRAHLSGREDFGFRLWSLVTLLIWEREVLARRAADAGQRDAGVENALAGEPRRTGDRAP